MALLLELPGIGPYTASAWRSLHRGKRAILVDPNVIRWLCRVIGKEYDQSFRREK